MITLELYFTHLKLLFMLGAIANPKKSFDIECDIKILKKNLEYLPSIDVNKKYKFTEKNDVLSTYTFEATELLSLGVFIDITLTSASESTTKVEIEIRRKVGAFDKSHEVQLANNHIKKISTLVAECTKLDDNKIDELKQKEAKAKEQKAESAEDVMKVFMWIGGIVIVGAIILFVLGYIQF